MRTNLRGFALVEIVIVIVLISGSMLVFLEALSQAKSYQVRSEVVTIQSLLLNSKTNQIRANGFNSVPISHGFIAAADYFILPSRWEGLPNAVLESLVLEPEDEISFKNALEAVSNKEKSFSASPEKYVPSKMAK